MRYQSLIIGTCLLVGAFLFGRFIDSSGTDSSTEFATTSSDESNATGQDASPSLAQLPSTSNPGRSLKDRLQGMGPASPGQSRSPFQLPSGDRSLVQDRDRESRPGSAAGALETESGDTQQPMTVTPDFSPLAGRLPLPHLLADTPDSGTRQPDEVVDAVPPLSGVLPRQPREPVGDSDVVVGPIGQMGATNHSPSASPPRSTMPPRQSTQVSPAELRQKVPFQLTARARSELAQVHRRSRRVTLDTNQFVNHTVELGETLQSISEKYFGRPDYYLDIYLANQDILINPSDVPAGRTLKIPVFEK